MQQLRISVKWSWGAAEGGNEAAWEQSVGTNQLMLTMFQVEPTLLTSEGVYHDARPTPQSRYALIATSLGRKLGSHHFWIVSDGTHRQTHAMRLHPLRIELTACSLHSSHKW
jgi:hypothetical protein